MKYIAKLKASDENATGYYCQVDERHWLILSTADIVKANATGRLAQMIDGIVEIDPDTLRPVYTFGGIIAARRKHLNLSQEKLAHRVGISRNYVSQIERDEAPRLSLGIFLRLGGALEIEDSELVKAWKGIR